MSAKKGLFDLHEMKRAGQKITWLTAYDYPTATFEEAAGVDMILVGDSLGMCVYGYPGTVPVTMDQCIVHSEAVRRGAPNTFVVGDMPLGSYQACDEDAVRNAIRFLKEANVDAIKLEGGVRTVSRVKAILDAGVAVCGHIGLTPQSSGQLGGHKAQGRTIESAKLVVEDARALHEAGVQLLLVEAVPPEVAAFIRDELPIPVLGIGAGEQVDGQLLIVSDVLGTFQAFTPRFVKKYADLAGVATPANVAEAATRALRASKTTYCPNAGIPDLREAIALDVGRARGLDYGVDNVSVQPGGKPVIGKFLLTMMNPGDEVLYPNPGFPIYSSLIEFFGGRAVPYTYVEGADRFSLDLDQIERLITPRTRLLILNDLHNPTGVECSAQELEALAALVRAHDLYVLCDEAYFDVRYQGASASLTSLPGMQERCVILYTFSKKYAMTGWRLGAAIGPRWFIDTR